MAGKPEPTMTREKFVHKWVASDGDAVEMAADLDALLAAERERCALAIGREYIDGNRVVLHCMDTIRRLK